MPVKSKHEEAVLSAIDRLVVGEPTKATDARLIDRNLIAEAGLSKATFYRCTSAQTCWRAVKEASVRAAIAKLSANRRNMPTTELTDEVLLREARIDHAALHRMPESLLEEWSLLKSKRAKRSRREQVADDPDKVINSLVNKLYGVTLALRQANETISRLYAEIDRLGGNVRPLKRTD